MYFSIIFLELLISFDICSCPKKMTKISKNYKPTKKEKFMNAKMKEYFRIKLVDWTPLYVTKILLILTLTPVLILKLSFIVNFFFFLIIRYFFKYIGKSDG